jgi:hypothetical protein
MVEGKGFVPRHSHHVGHLHAREWTGPGIQWPTVPTICNRATGRNRISTAPGGPIEVAPESPSSGNSWRWRPSRVAGPHSKGRPPPCRMELENRRQIRKSRKAREDLQCAASLSGLEALVAAAAATLGPPPG